MPFAICTGYLQRMAGFYLPADRKGSHLIIRKLAFHGKELAAVCQQLLAPAHQVPEGGERTAADLAIGLLRPAVFSTAVDNLHVGEAEFQYALVQKAGFLAVAVQQGKTLVRKHDGQGDRK